MYEFELGPIRPPSEAYSILLRITRNCPWNKCEFCTVYKGDKFSLRSVDEIKNDIDSMYAIYEKINNRLKKNNTNGYLNDDIISSLLIDDHIPRYYLRQMLFWMQYGMQSLFLQDADSMVFKTPDFIEILSYIRLRFPSIQRITCYSRSKTVAVKSPSELQEIRNAGLDRIHIGMESGSDDVLKLIRKGVTANEHIIAGKKIVNAGFELSEYFMPGIGGKKYTEQNSKATSRVLNEINPSFIRIRTTTPVQGTGLYKMMQTGEWEPLTEIEKIIELKNMIENLDMITSYIQSDHIMNLIEDANGKLPEDKNNILSKYKTFLNMSENDQECFIIARRTGNIHYLSDYNPESFTALRDRIKLQYGSIDKAVLELTSNFI